MSRAQWGNGYWKGVKDAQNGVATLPIDTFEVSCYLIARMLLWNAGKTENRSLVPVSEYIRIAELHGVSINLAKEIYDYILDKTPLGCYVSGHPKSPWTDDFFVLPNLSLEDADGIVDVFQKEWAARFHYDELYAKEERLLRQAREEISKQKESGEYISLLECI